MTWCNRFEIHYLFDDILGSFLSILIPCIILYGHSSLPFLHCTWLECINSCTKDLSHGFLTNKWFVHSRFVDLLNPFEIVVHHLLIRGINSFSCQDEVSMKSALMCKHWIGPIVSHDIDYQVVMTSPSYYTVLPFNLERILNLCKS